jgi:thiamine-phosphate pyrophosphorylase
MVIPDKMDFNFGAYVITSKDHVKIAREACRGGAKVIQYRDKISLRQEMLDIADEIRKITKEYNSLFIVNDFIDIALMSGADGIHLGQEDIPIKRAREIIPDDFIIGFSTHSYGQAVEAEKAGADYIGIGPVFATPTKKNYSPIGFSVVKEVIKSVNIPVVAIGGINIKNIDELVSIGVQNIAMVREFQEKTHEKVKKVNFLLKV